MEKVIESSSSQKSNNEGGKSYELDEYDATDKRLQKSKIAEKKDSDSDDDSADEGQDMTTLLSKALLEGRLANAPAYAGKLKSKSKRHIANRIFKTDTRAHFSDSDNDFSDIDDSDDDSDEEGKLNKSKNNKSKSSTSQTTKTKTAPASKAILNSSDSYLPVIYKVRDIYEED